MAIFCCRSQRDLRFRFAVHLRPRTSGPSRPLFLSPSFLTPPPRRKSALTENSVQCYAHILVLPSLSVIQHPPLASRMRALYFFRRPQVPFTCSMIKVGNEYDYTAPSVSGRPSVSSYSIFRWRREIGNSVGGMMGQRGRREFRDARVCVSVCARVWRRGWCAARQTAHRVRQIYTRKGSSA